MWSGTWSVIKGKCLDQSVVCLAWWSPNRDIYIENINSSHSSHNIIHEKICDKMCWREYKSLQLQLTVILSDHYRDSWPLTKNKNKSLTYINIYRKEYPDFSIRILGWYISSQYTALYIAIKTTCSFAHLKCPQEMPCLCYTWQASQNIMIYELWCTWLSCYIVWFMQQCQWQHVPYKISTWGWLPLCSTDDAKFPQYVNYWEYEEWFLGMTSNPLIVKRFKWQTINWFDSVK